MFPLLLFSIALIGFISAGFPILWALAVGYLIFFLDALKKGHRPAAIFRMSLSGIKTAKNILIIFLLIGMLTALWRSAGTIPSIVGFSAQFLHPSVMILMAFLLNCLVSFLTGTSFGTAATMGVIAMTMAQSMGCNPLLTGGAILSGTFFGDRCSPVSTSALLVSELTSTDIYENIRLMLKTALLPFLATCALYGGLGLIPPSGLGAAMDIQELFSKSFRLGLIPALPALLLLILALKKVPVRRSMAASIVTAFFITLLWQKRTLPEIFHLMIFGFQTSDLNLAPMINGGGILSMVNVAAIICISSSYSGIFDGTGLLKGLKLSVEKLKNKTSPFVAVFLTSLATSVIACNQTLTIILTNQICQDLEPDSKKLAINLENTAVLLSPLIPWSIAGAVPLATVGAPTASLLAACYLYLVPLWCLLRSKKSV